MKPNRYLLSAIKATLISISLFLSSSTMATISFNHTLNELQYYTVPNPMMRTCNLVGGFSVVINVNADQILLCHIGKSYIGSLELFLFKTENRVSENIQDFLSGITDTKKCTSVEIVSDLDCRSYELCFFSDGSIMDIGTFKKGVDHSDNQALKNVLVENN